jgi:S-DNA-T family DNA segregation ATPase FtsK/SpoIIIE
LLVFKGAGIASLVVGIAIGSLGLNLIYDKKILPVLKYLRWVSIALLLTAPILSYLFPHEQFPYPLGGALGDNSIDYFIGLIGKMGTGLLLLSATIIFLFVIVALDISPLIQKVKDQVAALMNSMSTPGIRLNEPEIDQQEYPESKV